MYFPDDNSEKYPGILYPGDMTVYRYPLFLVTMIIDCKVNAITWIEEYILHNFPGFRFWSGRELGSSEREVSIRHRSIQTSLLSTLLLKS